MWQRTTAALSLAAAAAAIAMAVVFLLRNPALLAGGVLGLLMIAAGGWWLVTEQYPRRVLGIVGFVGGVGVLVWAVFAAGGDSDTALWRIGLLLALVAAATALARPALTREIDRLDDLHYGHRRPQHPVLICNPKSGGGKVEQFGLIGLAQAMGVDVVTLEPGSDLAQLARDAIARGADCLGMAGGDGSQALVASIASEHDIPFVCISAGTRNHFALDLGLDRDDPRKGLVALVDGVERRVDYATVGDRLFVNNVSLGIYATIVQEDSYRDAKLDTSRAKLPEMLGSQAEPFDLQFTTPDGAEVEGCFLILVSNNPYVLGPALDVSQRRTMDSGRLGVFAVSASTGAEAAALVTRSALGLGARDPHLHEFTAESFQVRSRSGSAFAGVDGESLNLPTPLDFRIHAGGLRLLVPVETLAVAERRRSRGMNPSALLAVAAGRSPNLT